MAAIFSEKQCAFLQTARYTDFTPCLICLHKLLDDFFTRALCKEDFPGLPCAASLLPLNLPRDLEQNYASLADDRTLWDGIDNTNLFFFFTQSTGTFRSQA